MPNSNQVMSWAGITRRQLDNWITQGFVTPVHTSGQGFGGLVYDWTTKEAEVAVRMGRLVRAGVAPRVAARVARGDRAVCGALMAALRGCLTELGWQVLATEGGQPQAAPLAEGGVDS